MPTPPAPVAAVILGACVLAFVWLLWDVRRTYRRNHPK